MEKLNFRVKARKASPKARKYGILGNATVELLNSDKSDTLILIDNIAIRKSKKKGQRPWISMPQIEFQGRDGETQYKTVVKIAPNEDMDDEDGLKAYFDGLILNALKKAMKSGDDDDEPRRRKPKKQRSKKRRRKPEPEWDDDDDDDEPFDDDNEWEDADDDDDEDIW